MGAGIIEIVEVGPRDGLQNEDMLVATDQKVELIGRLVASGLTRIEAVSFVHPRLVPQMADAEAVMAALPDADGVSYIGLALNERGVQRALDAGVDEVNFVVVATDTFSMRNQGCTTAESMEVWERLTFRGYGEGARFTVTVGAAFGCPFEGEVPVDRVVEIATRVAAAGAAEITLADTIGVASPGDVTRRFGAVRDAVGPTPLRCHFHNTRNTGLANAYAATMAGVRSFDASIGGLGGCPFAPDATGNIPTEDLAYMLQRMGRAAELSLAALIRTAQWLETSIGKRLPGMLMRAGPFPAVAERA
ncbi:MAG: hydroxymethylglutaryl-CoA lyase [bacterium]|nr:hydroxymethylglutaryl-CoA lyase [bacterium]MDE0287866.1 hydroxymethylglutaryl-CoA lyase [bacterium]MDE0439798.1 hydroxymethylglutaryl-CoA lyase [bacterium]